MTSSRASPTPRIDLDKLLDTSCLKGRSALVTGGANGIGRAFARALAGVGVFVTIADKSEEDGNAVAESLVNEGLHAQFVHTDVTSWESQNSAFKSACSFSPECTVDLVIACAGLYPRGHTIKRWLKTQDDANEPTPPSTAVLDINTTGAFYTTHLALHYFRKTATSASGPSKQLILIVSLAGYGAIPNVVDYTTSKFGVRGIWKSVQSSGNILGDGKPVFRANVIVPTYIKTKMTEGMEPFLNKLGIQMATTEDCVQGMMRLACDEEIRGRALVIAPDGKSFDCCDDIEGIHGGKVLDEKINDGTLRNMYKITALNR